MLQFSGYGYSIFLEKVKLGLFNASNYFSEKLISMHFQIQT